MTSPFDLSEFNRTLSFPRADPSPTPVGAEDILEHVRGAFEAYFGAVGVFLSTLRGVPGE